jgi:hypothetical protein
MEETLRSHQSEADRSRRVSNYVVGSPCHLIVDSMGTASLEGVAIETCLFLTEVVGWQSLVFLSVAMLTQGFVNYTTTLKMFPKHVHIICLFMLQY